MMHIIIFFMDILDLSCHSIHMLNMHLRTRLRPIMHHLTSLKSSGQILTYSMGYMDEGHRYMSRKAWM